MELDLKHLTWDYAGLPGDDTWRARRLAEFFPFVAERLTAEERELLLRELDRINLPDERKEFIRLVCRGEKNGK
ncbi:MAG: hypothetical protein JRJ09_18015 [Deltaproteobacteria bacterium]|nr:hypothetical protein [Deltaproteobacteria bacterium]HDZ91917.1 hypothetical protein [Deltaproteobacteria bacterium]